LAEAHVVHERMVDPTASLALTERRSPALLDRFRNSNMCATMIRVGPPAARPTTRSIAGRPPSRASRVAPSTELPQRVRPSSTARTRIVHISTTNPTCSGAPWLATTRSCGFGLDDPRREAYGSGLAIDPLEPPRRPDTHPASVPVSHERQTSR
jgi:hypothetical protein